jgi:glutaredoxin-related protein
MSEYAERHVIMAIQDAEAAYGWDIKWDLIDQYTKGLEVVYTYALDVVGRDAETQAVRHFSNYQAFDDVYVEASDQGFAEIVIEVYD